MPPHGLEPPRVADDARQACYSHTFEPCLGQGARRRARRGAADRRAATPLRPAARAAGRPARARGPARAAARARTHGGRCARGDGLLACRTGYCGPSDC
eukprot:scaffold51565_cov74-Phaeocystis_antarctica.AAC.1